MFQNCSQVNFVNLESPLFNLKNENNGGGYSGKPDGEYYRFRPDFTCEDNDSSPISDLLVTSNKATLTENKKFKCGASKSDLDLSRIDSSIYQNEIIGYQEGIFDGSVKTPSSIPASLVEVWCRDPKDPSGIETITHYNHITKKGVTKIFYSSSQSGSGPVQTISDFDVARSLGENLIVVNGITQNFKLEVYRDRPASELGLFKAHLDTMIEKKVINQETYCRLGGTLDPSVWPALQVVDLNIQNLSIAPDAGSFAFSAPLGLAPPTLFSSDFKGVAQKKLSPPLLYSGVTNFDFTPDSSQIFFRGDQSAVGQMELFKINTDASHFSFVSSAANTFNPNPKNTQFSQDQKLAFFVRSVQNSVTQSLGDNLYFSPVNGSVLTQVNLSPTIYDKFYGVWAFAFSPPTQKLAFVAGSMNYDLFISNMDGTPPSKISLPLPGPSWAIPRYPDPLQIPEQGRIAIVETMDYKASGFNVGFQYYAVSLDTLKVTQLPVNMWVVSISSDQLKVILQDGKYLYHLFSIQDSRLIDITDMKDVFFSHDSLLAYGTVKRSDYKTEAKAYSFADQSEISICPESAGDLVHLSEGPLGQIFIASFDSAKQIIKIFTKSAGQCELKNSLPAANYNALNISVSPDNKKVLLKMKSATGRDSLAFVPLDGTPAYMVDTPLFSTGTIISAQFLKDSSSIFYFGQQLRPGETNAFLWTPQK